MFNLQKINDKFQAIEFYEYVPDNYLGSDLLTLKFQILHNFVKPKNKFNHIIGCNGKFFNISNKELFVESLINLLTISEKYLLYSIFIQSKNHFITSRPKLLNIYKNNIKLTEYIIYDCLSNYISFKKVNIFDVNYNEIINNWSDYILDCLKEDAEYNEYSYTQCLSGINSKFKDYKLVINYKYLFENTVFSKNFWNLYQFLIFHPHLVFENINYYKIITLKGNSAYFSSEECIFKYLNEHLTEFNMNNLYELFSQEFISYILNNTINGKYIQNNVYDPYFKQFVNYCRKNLNK